MGPAPEPAWKPVGELLSIGMTMVVATVIGLAAGWGLDRWLGTAPWLTMLGLGFGIAAAFVALFRAVSSIEQRSDDPD